MSRPPSRLGNLSRHRDLAVAGGVAGWILGVLVLDAGAGNWQQHGLGLATWVLLATLLRRELVAVRLQVAVAVIFATWIEYTFAGQLGVYTYRLHNIPAFVPPGHGLVYLGALALGRSALFRSRRRLVLGTVLAAGGCWALWGLLLAPRRDVLGALWFGCLVAFIVRGRAPLVYAGAFLLTAYLEVLGTALGIWTWGLHDPTGLLSIGNPPSGVAGGYCFFDAAALALAPRLAALLSAATRGRLARRRLSWRADCRNDLTGAADRG